MRHDPESRTTAQKHLKRPFHNPYTFIPFPLDEQAPPRAVPTLHTADEAQQERFTGVIELRIKTLSPLMTLEGDVLKFTGEHKHYRALTIGNDVIVPKTGIRGALRTLATIILGGSVGYIDEHLHLTQGRDRNARLGPRTPRDGQDVPANVFLARVIEPGSETRPGLIQLGDARKIEIADLQKVLPDIDKRRPGGSNHGPLYVALDGAGRPGVPVSCEDRDHPWQLKLSGPMRNKKRDYAFQGHRDSESKRVVIELPARLWAEYNGRHRHAKRDTLKHDDLVWLQPHDSNAGAIIRADQIKSLQWARWGRTGKPLVNCIPQFVRPCNTWPVDPKNGFQVDMVTDLFGQLGSRTDARHGREPSFAARVQPENLVFADARNRLLPDQPLAPLCQPHPGCLAFYEDPENPGFIAGYKVYRRSDPADKPWQWAQQPIFQGSRPKEPHDKVNKSAQLLPAEVTGTLRLGVYSLSEEELAFVLTLCKLPWRLGGGKPLGLGACSVDILSVRDELGASIAIPTGRMKQLWERLNNNIGAWQASQKPVKRLRYPRASKEGQTGGHVWFGYFAKPGTQPREITRFLVEDESGRHEINGQPLPPLTANPADDELYGYGVKPDSRKEGDHYIHRIPNEGEEG